jgi:hypothetical protein
MHGRVVFVSAQRGVAGLWIVVLSRQTEPVEVPLTELEPVSAAPDTRAESPPTEPIT